jgi:hypothetical protein
MRVRADNKEDFDEIPTEADVRAELEHEQRTAQRQELLKILWKLTRRSSGAETYLSVKNAPVGFNAERASPRSTTRQRTDLSASC